MMQSQGQSNGNSGELNCICSPSAQHPKYEIDSKVTDLLTRLGWTIVDKFEKFNTNHHSTVTYLSKTSKILVSNLAIGSGYLAAANPNTSEIELFHVGGNIEPVNLSNLVLEAALGTTVSKAAFDIEYAKSLVNSKFEINLEYQSSIIEFAFMDRETDCTAYISLANINTEARENMLAALIAIHGFDALGIQTTEGQRRYIEATKDCLKAAELLHSLMRIEKIDTQEGSEILIGNHGTPISELVFLDCASDEHFSGIPGYLPLLELLEIHPNLEATLISTAPANKIRLLTCSSGETTSFDIRTDCDTQKTSVSSEILQIPADLMSPIDLTRLSREKERIVEAMKCIGPYKMLTDNHTLHLIIQCDENEPEVFASLRITAARQSTCSSEEILFHIPPGKSGNFIFVFLDTDSNCILYGVTAARDNNGELRFLPYIPSQNISELTKCDDLFFVAWDESVK